MLKRNSTDRQTDQPTDRPTDQLTFGIIEATLPELKDIAYSKLETQKYLNKPIIYKYRKQSELLMLT